jgi:hypothetical protein
LFNSGRLYFQVELLSDITTADGKSIRRTLWKGTKDRGHENFVPIRYNQPQPGETAWSVWRTVLKKTYGCNDYGILEHKIGSAERAADWVWFLHLPTDRLFQKQEENWKVRTRVLQGRRTRQCQYGNEAGIAKPYEDVIPNTVYQSGDYFRIDGKGTASNRVIPPVPRTWIQNTDDSIIGNVSDLVDFLNKDEIIIMGDGSTKDGKAAAAWIISTKAARND